MKSYEAQNFTSVVVDITIGEDGSTSSDVAYGHNVIVYGYKNGVYKIYDVNGMSNKAVSSFLLGDYLTFRYIGEHNHLSELRFKNKGCVGSWCPCGQYTVCEHNVVNDDCSCASCGIYLHDFHINLLHFTSTYHYKVCSKCNYSVAEEHIMRPKPSGLYCEICGYDTTSSGEITLGTGEHTH